MAPLEASPAGLTRHRLSRGGNRRLNAILYRIALTQARRSGLSRGAFVRRQLTRLDLDTELTTLRYGSDRVRLPPLGDAADTVAVGAP